MNYQLDLFSEPQAITNPVEIIKNHAGNPEQKLIVSWGVGTNSTAMLILCKKLGIRPDYILFADTGGESYETYEYLEYFQEWLVKNDMPKPHVVRASYGNTSEKRKTYASAKKTFKALLFCDSVEVLTYVIWWVGVTGATPKTLEESCLITQTLPSMAYNKKACSRQWKIEPQDRFAKEQGLFADGQKVRKFIGYHAGEWSRAVNKKSKQLMLEDEHYIYEYPLIKYGINQLACNFLIQSEGLRLPPKSSCFFCPNRTPSEILALPEEMRERGNLIERTNEMGIHFQPGTSIKGLGRNVRWQSLGELTPLEATLLEQKYRQCSCVDFDE